MAHAEEKEWFGFLVPSYMWVWVALLVLTIVEVLVPEPQLVGLDSFPGLGIVDPRTLQVLSLIMLALVKTFLVAWYYMHLVSERPSIILIGAAPFIFSTFLTIGLFPWPA